MVDKKIVEYLLNNRERKNYETLFKKINLNFIDIKDIEKELVIIKTDKELSQFLKNNLKHNNYYLNLQNNIFKKMNVEEILNIVKEIANKNLNYNFLYIPKNKKMNEIKKLIDEFNNLISLNKTKKFYLNIDLDIKENKLMEIIENLKIENIDFNFSSSNTGKENFFKIIPKIKNKVLGLRKLKTTNFECENLFKNLDLREYNLTEKNFSLLFFKKFGFVSFSRWVGGGYFPLNNNFKRLNKYLEIEKIESFEVENNYNYIEENQKQKLSEKQIKSLNSKYYVYNLTDSIIKNINKI